MPPQAALLHRKLRFLSGDVAPEDCESASIKLQRFLYIPAEDNVDGYVILCAQYSERKETRNIQPRYIPGHGYIPAPLPFAWEMIANNGEIRGHYKKCESGDLPIVQYDRPPAAPITSITQMAVVLNIWRTIVMISCNHLISNKPRTNPNRIATINNLVA